MIRVPILNAVAFSLIVALLGSAAVKLVGG